MHFLTLLKSGVSVEIVSQNFVDELLRKSWDNNCLCLELACDFVHDILKPIGLSCHITPEQINNNITYDWPMEQIQIYNFHYIEADFKKLEKFILLLCSNFELQNQKFLEQPEYFLEDDLEPPIHFLMDLVAIWCSVYRQLLKLEELQAFKRFEEPFARINLQLLLGMHDMRKKYSLEIKLLDAICERLYISAIQGLFYKECHDMIFTALLQIISKDYDFFYGKSTRSINFFYEAFAVEINSLTHLKIYQALQTILSENEASPNNLDDNNEGVATNSNKLNILINVLIEPSMLQVYFTTFVTKKKGKDFIKTQQEALKFLNILQSKLLTLDCFSRGFMEAILYLVLKTDSTTAALASTLYINMMKRKFPEQILKHIMDFYVAHFDSIVYVKSCISTMYDSFSFVLNFKNFLEIITDADTEEIIRLLSAHMLVIVFEIKSKDSTAKQEIEGLLQILPGFFETLQCQKIIGILLQVFNKISIEDLQKSTVDNFIHNVVEVFTDIEINMEYPLLMNMFNIFHKCLNSNHEWHHLELLTNDLTILYQEMIKELKTIKEIQNVALFKTKLPLFNGLLKRLVIILKTKYDLFDICLKDMWQNLSKYVLFNVCVLNVITAEKSFIDLYTLEICLSCIMKLSPKQTETTQNDAYLIEAEKLLKYVWTHVQNMDNVLKMPVVRIKTYFDCLLQLYTYLPLKFENNVYHQLIQILINVNFKNKSFNRKRGDELQQLHPLQSMEYQRLMLKQFTEMHKFPSIEVNTTMIWKLCIHYGMPKHSLDEELKHLLITLANYRLKIYKNIISVLIYNLYNQSPALKSSTIVSIIKKHKHLIDNEICVESPHLLKIHVVLMVLQIIEKALTVQRLKIGNNRVEALKHLNIFIEELDLNQLQAKQLMDEQLSNYQNHLLTEEERKYVDNFKHLSIVE